MTIWHFLTLAMGALVLGSFGILADEVSKGSTSAFDTWLLLALRGPGDPAKRIGPDWLGEVARDITSLRSVAVLSLFVLAFVGYLALSGKRWTALFLSLSADCGAVLSTILKIVLIGPGGYSRRSSRLSALVFPADMQRYQQWFI